MGDNNAESLRRYYVDVAVGDLKLERSQQGIKAADAAFALQLLELSGLSPDEFVELVEQVGDWYTVARAIQ